MDAHDILAAKIAELKLAGRRKIEITIWTGPGMSFKGPVREIHADSVDLQLVTGTTAHPSLSNSIAVVDRRHIIAFVIEGYYP
jgi:hypothetical protein